MIHAITWDVKPQIIDLGFIEIRWYSLMFLLGFLIGYYILSKMYKKEGVSLELLEKLTVYAVLGTIIGARFGHCIFYEPEVYLKNPLKIILPFTGTPGIDFRFTGYQGLASHGGAVGVAIALYLYTRKYKLPYIWILDRIVVVTALAGALIRLGNLFNSEIYGHPTDLPWGFRFMAEARYYGIEPENVLPKHPTQIYEALSYLAIFILLMYLYYKKEGKPRPGLLIGLFFILVFTARFFIEFLKEDQVAFESGMVLNMGQWLSIPFVIIGAVLLFVKIPQKEVKTT